MMEPDFWHERWENNLIGFHSNEVNPYLRTHWSKLSLEPAARVLVPLCGKSLDLIWLAEQGYQVVGVELSPIAV
ncbi:MAG: thiopurine S-methyltransferase, partial [Thiohalophilus sp.]